MRDVEFKNYSAKYEDADGDEHTSTVRAHVADKDTADALGTVATRTGSHDVRKGDVLVETDRPGVYDVHSSKSWDDIGYTEGDGASASQGSSEPVTTDNPTGTDQGESGTDEETNDSNPATSRTTPRRK